MVERQIVGGATILAQVAVSPENILPGQHHPFVGQMHITIESDNGWHWKLFVDSTEMQSLRFGNEFGFAQVNQQKRFRNGTDAKRTVILV